MKIQNPFRFGLAGGLGVIVAIGIGQAIGNLATILTYVGAALFLSLGIDPIVSFLTKRGWPRWLAILIVLAVVLGAFAGLVFALVPVIIEQISKLIGVIPTLFTEATQNQIHMAFPWLDVRGLTDQAQAFMGKLDITKIGNGLLTAGIGIASAVTGGFIVLVLTLYFVSSLGSIKRGLYQLVPASKRVQFIDLSEQISQAVGRYVIGQASLGLINGVLSFVFLTWIFPLFGIPVQYSVLLAFIAFLGSLIPLVGTVSAAAVITLGVLAFNGAPSVFVVAIYYLIYMQVEAYLISPRIMNQAVSVPGVVVVIAALAGGTLLGVLGALVAIPVAASILLIIKQVFIPRQNAL